MSIIQQLLNISYQHIIRQGKPSYENGSCRYKSSDGSGCAAAPFIINYSSKMEGNYFIALVEDFPEALIPEAIENGNFIFSLQKCHDKATRDMLDNNAHFLELYKKNIHDLVAKCGLTFPPENP